MKKSLIIFTYLLVVFLGCKSSNTDFNKQKVIKLGNGSVRIDSFKTDLVEYDDSKVFHLAISVSSKNGKKYKRTIRINNNRPKGRIINNGEYEYIDFMLSSPFFEVMTDENGERNFYFISDSKFRLIVDQIHYLDIKPILGKKMILSIYLD